MTKKTFGKQSFVLLDMSQSHYQLPFLVEAARKHKWRFFDLALTSGVIPTDIDIMGAITTSIPDSELSQKLRCLGCPVVRIGRSPHPEDHLQPAVMPDLYNAGKMVADHFYERDFHNLGYIGQKPWRLMKPLYDGFSDRCHELNAKCHLLRLSQINHKSPQDTFDFRYSEITSWLKSRPKPIGIFAYNTKLGSRIDMIAKTNKIDIPGEISLVCFINSPECEMTYTPLSAIDINPKSIADKAVELLHNLLLEKSLPSSRIVVPPKGIVLRQSSDILAVEDPNVAKALMFIWHNLQSQISVKDIAFEAGIPHRTLARSFKRCLGRSINEELRRKRLELSCKLLSQTEMTIMEITQAVGFSSKAYFHKVFLQEYGITPSQFRQNKNNIGINQSS